MISKNPPVAYDLVFDAGDEESKNEAFGN